MAKDNHLDHFLARMEELRTQGLDRGHAFAHARLESSIAQWPSEWGDELRVFLYGDFDPPSTEVAFPALGIRILPGRVENPPIRTALTVVRAHITVPEKSLEGVLDASRRINVLLGAWTLVGWGNGAVDWWCHITHPPEPGHLGPLEEKQVELATDAVLRLPTEVRRKIEAALFWIRQARHPMGEMHHRNELRQHTAYWLAFECLVHAISLMRPPKKLSKVEKEQRIADTISAKQGKLTPDDIAQLCRTVVDQGFVAKAKHALQVCFGSDAQYYATELFDRPQRSERLYYIRNSINHGNVDAENPEELARISGKLFRLFILVWNMFAFLIPFGHPVDSKELRERL